jgi:cobyrinic acid a,c-diamide synthase
MEGTLESTRHEWAEGNRRLQAAAVGDRTLYERLLAEVDLVLEQLRRRVGQTFTLRELASAYGEADRWVQEAMIEAEPAPGWPARTTIAQDAAFHLYSRGALDYRP